MANDASNRRRSQYDPASREPSPDASEGILYSHPSGRIVSFTPPTTAKTAAPPSEPTDDRDYPVDAIETLPWKASTEKTVVLGKFRIEKVLGSTIFIKSGNSFLKAIMKNSQCWCVDGISIFVIRARKLTYYRIELPHETEEDKKLVEDLKEALAKILRYETTPCPFKRGFHVDLSEVAKTKKKKPWRPKEKPKPAVVEVAAEEVAQETKSRGQLEAPSMDSTSGSEDTDGTDTTMPVSISDQFNGDNPEIISDESDDESSFILEPPPLPLEATRALEAKRNMRTASAPSQFWQRLDAQQKEVTAGRALSVNTRPQKTLVPSRSVDSFHSMQSESPSSSPRTSTPPSPVTARPTEEQLKAEALDTTTLGPELEITVSHPEDEPQESDSVSVSDSLRTAAETNDSRSPSPQDERSPEPQATSPTQQGGLTPSSSSNSILLRRRRTEPTSHRRRDLSPLPPPSTLYHPSSSDTRTNHLTTLILQKTASVVLGPPLQFLTLLFGIAGRIAAANQNGRRWSVGADGEFGDDEEDDYLPFLSGRWEAAWDLRGEEGECAVVDDEEDLDKEKKVLADNESDVD